MKINFFNLYVKIYKKKNKIKKNKKKFFSIVFSTTPIFLGTRASQTQQAPVPASKAIPLPAIRSIPGPSSTALLL